MEVWQHPIPVQDPLVTLSVLLQTDKQPVVTFSPRKSASVSHPTAVNLLRLLEKGNNFKLPETSVFFTR